MGVGALSSEACCSLQASCCEDVVSKQTAYPISSCLDYDRNPDRMHLLKQSDWSGNAVTLAHTGPILIRQEILFTKSKGFSKPTYQDRLLYSRSADMMSSAIRRSDILDKRYCPAYRFPYCLLFILAFWHVQYILLLMTASVTEFLVLMTKDHEKH